MVDDIGGGGTRAAVALPWKYGQLIRTANNTCLSCIRKLAWCLFKECLRVYTISGVAQRFVSGMMHWTTSMGYDEVGARLLQHRK